MIKRLSLHTSGRLDVSSKGSQTIHVTAQVRTLQSRYIPFFFASFDDGYPKCIFCGNLRNVRSSHIPTSASTYPGGGRLTYAQPTIPVHIAYTITDPYGYYLGNRVHKCGIPPSR